MQIRWLLIILIISLCASCAAPRVYDQDIQVVQTISLAIDTTMAHDISGTTDSLDLPASMTITNKLLELATDTLTEKGFRIVDYQRSVGMADPNERYYVLATKKDRKRDTSQLKRRRGPFYSDRLSSSQLDDLYKDMTKVRVASNSAVSAMGFAGDAALLIQARGRTIGGGKDLLAVMANIASMSLYILNLGIGGSPDLMEIGDSYHVNIRMYRTRDGRILWRKDFKSDSIKEMLRQTVEILRNGLPTKPLSLLPISRHK